MAAQLGWRLASRLTINGLNYIYSDEYNHGFDPPSAIQHTKSRSGPCYVDVTGQSQLRALNTDILEFHHVVLVRRQNQRHVDGFMV